LTSGRQRQRLVGRPDRARDEARAAVARLIVVRRASRDAGRGQVHLAHQMDRAIILLADHIGVEGVGRHHVRAGVEIGARDRLDHVRPGQHEQVVIALLVERQVVRAAIIRFAQTIVLDHRAERAVGQQDALGGLLAKALGGL
jgi:hypothetical protein